MPSDLTALLACPRCDRALDRNDSGYHCAGCHIDFPLIDGIPWLFAEPDSTLAEWRSRFNYLVRSLEADAKRHLNAANRTDILASTKARLESMAQAITDHCALLQALLAPLGSSEPSPAVETLLALRTRLPPDQGLMTYFPNVHRDWSWGDEENAASIHVVLDALAGHPSGPTLILGSGGGRLAFDWHERVEPELTVAVDFNPLLGSIARRVTRGEQVELFEFPLAPVDSDQVAVRRNLAAPNRARNGLEFVTADVQRAPFREKSFRVIVTPWLVDILPGEFAKLCARINRWLDDDGIWINFGSLNFHLADPAARLSAAECIETVKQQGFSIATTNDTQIPYLCSPASRHSRRELVFSWGAIKTRRAKRPQRYQALPDWIVRGNEPVPAIEHFQVAAMSTRIHAHVMSMIDGKRTISDMARILEQQRLMPAADAEASIRGLLIKLFDESQIRRP